MFKFIIITGALLAVPAVAQSPTPPSQEARPEARPSTMDDLFERTVRAVLVGLLGDHAA